MAKKKITVKEAINVLNTKYANTLGMLDDALDPNRTFRKRTG